MDFVSSPSPNSTNEVPTAYGVSTTTTQSSTASTQVSTINLSDATLYTFLSNQSNVSQLVHEDLEQIHEDDIEEIDLKWQLALLSMRAKRFFQKTGRKITINGSDTAGFDKSKNQESSRRTVNVEETPPKAMVAIDGVCFEWSYMAEDEVPTNMALMDFLDIEVKDKVLDNKDCSVKSPVVVEKKIVIPTNAKIELVKAKQQEKLVWKPVKNNAPRAVLKKTSLRPLNTARLVNTTHPKTTVYSARLILRFSKSAQATIKRPYQQRTTFTNKSFRKTVNTTRPRLVNTASPRPVNTVRLRPVNAARPNSVVVNIQVSDGLGPQKKLISLFYVQGHPQQVQEDQGYIDSGCSRHMTGNLSYLSKFKEFNGGYVTFGGGEMVEKLLMCDKKNTVLFSDTEYLVLSPNFKLPEENQTLIRVPRRNNMLVVTNDYSRYTWVFFLTSKDETLGILKKFITEIENLVFMYSVMNDFCAMKGIKREFSVARTLQQNGVAERRNKTLIEVARHMLADSMLLTTFWAEAVNTACYVQNKALVVKPHNKTPYELFRGRTPALSFMKPFGCHFTILNTLVHLGKFDGKADEGYFVRYSMHSKAFRVYNIKTRRVDESLHIEFLENKPIVAGTNSNDFLGTEEHIGQSHSSKETGSSQDYILILNINTDRLTVSTASPEATHADFPGDKPKGDMSNINTTYQVPSTPNTRIHKDHSLNLVIGDVQSGEELLKFKLQKIWILVDLPKGKKAISTKWVFRNKKDERCILITKKARLVVQGYTQEEVIDYDEVFSPIARIEAIRVFLDYASFMGFMVYQMDVKSDFLYGRIEEEVYVYQPLGFEDPDHPDKVYKVVKALSGLHQAPRAWSMLMTLSLALPRRSYVKTTSTPVEMEKPLVRDLDDFKSLLRFPTYMLSKELLDILKDVIENGNNFQPVAQTTTNDADNSTTHIPSPVTADEKAQKKNDVKARSMLLMELPNEHLMTFNQYKDAKTLFAAIETRSGRNEATNDSKESSKETIVEQEVKGTTSTNLNSQNMAFVSSPSPNSTNEVHTDFGVSTASHQVSTANLSDATMYAFLANQPNRSQMVHEDLEQIHEDDLEEMDLKWQLALLSMRAKRVPRNQENRTRNQETTRRTVNVEDMSSKAIVAINEAGFDWSYMADDEAPTNMAFMAFSDSELEKISKEKDDLDIKIEKFENASQSLDKLIGSQITDKKFVEPNVKSYGVKHIEVVTQTSSVKIFEPFKENNGTPLIEDWESEGDDEARCKYHQRERMVNGTNHSRINHTANTVPKVMLTRTGLKPVNYVRPGSQFSTFFVIKRSFQRITSYNNRNFFQKVNTAKGKVNTSRPNSAVLNAVRENNGKVVKASACWVWRPIILDSASIVLKKHTYIDEFDGGYVAFEGGAKGGKITGKGITQNCHVLLKVPRKNNMYSVDMKNIVPKKDLTCLDANATNDELMLWYRRLGHIYFKNINKLVKENLVRGLF
nr:retrovirus-related Pol polyprotein from transposon TNT 1-94 [Tanacetum cinerariifolium]